MMTKTEAAKLCGVTIQTLDGWWKSGVSWFPQEAVTVDPNTGRAVDWNTDLILERMRARNLLAKASSDSGGNIQKLKTAKLLEEVRLAKLAVEKAEFEKRKRQRNILPRLEYEAFLADVIIVTRDTLQSIPGQLAKIGATPDQQGKIYAESERVVRGALLQMEDLLQRKGDLSIADGDDDLEEGA